MERGGSTVDRDGEQVAVDVELIRPVLQAVPVGGPGVVHAGARGGRRVGVEAHGELQQELARLAAKDVGLIIKIETKKGFKNLPKLLLTAMRRYPVAVMIARGDLGVQSRIQ